jgi:tRNA(fMet)-specific endonuclease VapC
MKKILLDTNAYGRLLAGDEAVLDVVADAAVVYLSVFVLAELYAGFRGGTREAENRRRLGEFTRRSPVHILPADEQTAEVFGELYYRLKVAGTPIPVNDLWIAAQAVEQGAFVVSFDEHFARVPGLLLWPPPSLGGAGRAPARGAR